jgi:hypothetical protein
LNLNQQVSLRAVGKPAAFLISGPAEMSAIPTIRGFR